MRLAMVLSVALAIAIAIGTVVWLGTALAALMFRRRQKSRSAAPSQWPAVSILKPVCGLEKNLRENLRTACEQDYPEYQVVYSVQSPNDPALPILRELEREFGPARATVVVGDVEVGMNGKINNLAGALPHARYDVFVISDSDVGLRPDYLKAIVAPLCDARVGGVSTYFKAVGAVRWYEEMELLTLNVDHLAIALFATMIGISDFCLGASFAFRKSTLEAIGGLDDLGNYLVEDNELGQRILKAGLSLATVPYIVDTTIDLRSPGHWWQKMTYWDQNTRAARPLVFTSALVLRTIPLALAFAALRGFDTVGLGVAAAAVLARMLQSATVLGVACRDVRSLGSLWLLPLKDFLTLVFFARALVKRTVIWRGIELALTRDGRFVPPGAEGQP